MDIKIEIGRRIKAARNRAGLTAKALAERTGRLKPTRISNWEHGARTPGPAEVKLLAEVLNVSAAYLMCLSDHDELAGDTALPRTTLIPIVKPADLISVIQQASLSTTNISSVLAEEYIPIIKNNSVNAKDLDVFALRIRDKSMVPEFKLDDIIIIDLQLKPRPGDYVLAAVNDEIIFRKYSECQYDATAVAAFSLSPLNSDWAAMRFTEQPERTIIGTLRELRRQPRT